MRTKRMTGPIAAALLLALSAAATFAQPASQGQTPPGTDAGPQRPDPSAIPEKIGPSIESKKPSAPEEQTGQGKVGSQSPHNRGLDLKEPERDSNTLSEPPASRPQSQL
jgi:hypothetical protein